MSILSEMEDEPIKSNRPKNTSFHQQRLKAWRPVLRTKVVIPIFFFIGILFTGLGIFLFITSNSVLETVVEYTHCEDHSQSPPIRCSDAVRIPAFYSSYNTCLCSLRFELKEDYPRQVYVYYGLSNFYQNHRRYVMSRDDNQLNGGVGVPNANCEPYRYSPENKIYAPCGAIASTIFNDTITIKYHGLPSNELQVPKDVPVTNKGIAWRSDAHIKFGKPPADSWAKTVKPDSWRLSALERSNDAYMGDEDLMVWMRIAPLSTFRKLYRLVVHNDVFSDGLPAGVYSAVIQYAYPVTQFGGTKRIVISTMNWLGGRNPSLGIAYVIVGVICILLGIIFSAIHIVVKKTTHS